MAKPDKEAIQQVRQECAGIRTRMAARAISRAYDEAFRPLGLRGTQFTLLVAIEGGAPESISGLADWLAMERTTLTRNLRLLEKRGLLAFGEEGYRRARPMRLTDKGREVLARALPRWRAVQERLLANLGEARWQHARELLNDLTRLE